LVGGAGVAVPAVGGNVGEVPTAEGTGVEATVGIAVGEVDTAALGLALAATAPESVAVGVGVVFGPGQPASNEIDAVIARAAVELKIFLVSM